MKSNNSQTPKKTKKSHKFRNAMLAILFVALVGAASVVVTWAAASATGFTSVTNVLNSTTPVTVAVDRDYYVENSEYEPHSVLSDTIKAKNTSTEITATTESSHDEWVGLKLTYTVTFPKTVYAGRSGGVTICPYFTRTDDPVTCIYNSYDDFVTAMAQVSTSATAFENNAFDPLPDGFNTMYWEAYDDTKDFFIYKSTVAPQTTTPQALFNYVAVNDHQKSEYDFYPDNESGTEKSGTMSLYPISVINSQTYNSEGTLVDAATLANAGGADLANYVYVASLPTFNIQVTAYAVQADGLDLAAAKTALHDIAFES